MHGSVDVGGGEVIISFYYIDEAWMTCNTFEVLSAYGCQIDFGARGGFMCSVHVLRGSGVNLRCVVNVV